MKFEILKFYQNNQWCPKTESYKFSRPIPLGKNEDDAFKRKTKIRGTEKWIYMILYDFIH